MEILFKTIGLFGKTNAKDYSDILSSIYHHLSDELELRVIVEDHSVPYLTNTQANQCSLSELGGNCDLVISIGGDGTFLTAARALSPHDVPIVGINLGRLGFLVDISPNEMADRLDEILGGEYLAEDRFLLRAKIVRNGETIRTQTAMNEVVVQRSTTASMLEIKTHINGIFLNSQRSDGLIVSTPTGSTAYALSGGGPILHPTLNALVLVPINPHTLSNRPIVIGSNSTIEITFSQDKRIKSQVTCDDVAIFDIRIDDRIMIEQEPDPIRILHPCNHDFFETLRAKLNWSSGYNHS
ncbi:MAG: NAD(+) kinase [Methylococcales bacterium]